MTWQALIDTSRTPPLVIGYGPFSDQEVAEVKAEVPEYDVVVLEDDQFERMLECCWAWLLAGNTIVVTAEDTPPDV